MCVFLAQVFSTYVLVTLFSQRERRGVYTSSHFFFRTRPCPGFDLPTNLRVVVSCRFRGFRVTGLGFSFLGPDFFGQFLDLVPKLVLDDLGRGSSRQLARPKRLGEVEAHAEFAWNKK